MDRRTALRRLGVGGAVLAASGGLLPLIARDTTLICPDPTLGSGTSTGTVNGLAFNPVDAYGQKQGASFQWQYFATLTDKTGGACARFRANQTRKGERWLVLVRIGAHEDNATPVAPSTGTFTIGQRTPASGSPYYVVNATWASHSRNCRQSSEAATGGTVTYTTATDAHTTATDALLEGSFDLEFGPDSLAGTFTAPYCVLCVARPSKKTCLA